MCRCIPGPPKQGPGDELAASNAVEPDTETRHFVLYREVVLSFGQHLEPAVSFLESLFIYLFIINFIVSLFGRSLYMVVIIKELHWDHITM